MAEKTYVGIQAQKRRNNMRSVMMLAAFPLTVLLLTMIFFLFFYWFAGGGNSTNYSALQIVGQWFVSAAPWILGAVAIWFIIAFLFNTRIINRAAGSRPLERSENKRVYNLVENLCMAEGMPMPKVNVIEDGSLNAFASGLNDKSFTVTLTSGIIDTLDDDELEGVIAHELTHIRNRDVRLLVVSIVFVGIFTMIMIAALFLAPRVRGKNSFAVVILLWVIAGLAWVGSLCSSVTKFAISRKREFMADAGAAEMTRKPLALASALRKISGNYELETVQRKDVAQMFIHHAAKGGSGKSVFSSHPPIEERIRVLEQF